MELQVKLLNTPSGQAALSISVPPETSVRELKQRLQEQTEVPEDRQRLIYRGRVLQDGQSLTQSGLETGHTLHCVVRPAEVAPAQPEGTTQAGNQTEAVGGRRIMMGAFQGPSGNLLRESRLLSDIIRLGEGANQPNRAGRGGDAQEVQSNPHALEHIRQGLLTMHTMLSGMETPSVQGGQPAAAGEGGAMASLGGSASSASEASHTELSHPMTSGRRFFVGQWLDVKDTVNQWLEATVMEINAETESLKVHYNGWPTRWDEWLPFTSQRIAPFRTRTIHSFNSPFISPSPVSAVQNAPVTGQDDIRVVLPEVLSMVRRVSSYLETLSTMCEDDLMNQVPADEVRPWLQASMPWEAERAREEERKRRRREEEEEVDGGDTGQADGDKKLPAKRQGEDEDSEETRRCRKRSIHDVAADVAPLLDRCGRLLADLAPHVSTLGTSGGASATPEVQVSGGAAPEPLPGASSAGVASDMEQSGSSSTTTRTGRSAVRERGGRSRTPSPDTAFRQLIPPPRSGGLAGIPALSSNIDIHIHAFVTPLRTAAGTTGTATAATSSQQQQRRQGSVSAPLNTASSGAGQQAQAASADPIGGLLSQALGLSANAATWNTAGATQRSDSSSASRGPSSAANVSSPPPPPSSTTSSSGPAAATATPNAYYGLMSSSLLASPTNNSNSRHSTATGFSDSAEAAAPTPESSAQASHAAQQEGLDSGGAGEAQQQNNAGGLNQIFSLFRRFSS